MEGGILLRKEQIGFTVLGTKFLTSTRINTIFTEGTRVGFDHHLYKDLLIHRKSNQIVSILYFI